MQNTASPPADQYEAVLGRLPPDLDLDALARQTKAIERGRKIGTGTALLRLALARGPGGLSLSQTAAWASMLGLADMSEPAVKYRLDRPAPAKLVPAKAGGGGRSAVGFLDAVMTRQLAAQAPGAAVRWAGHTLRDARACPRA
jgi:hypothetical protein